jgi:hypothetical protein
MAKRNRNRPGAPPQEPAHEADEAMDQVFGEEQPAGADEPTVDLDAPADEPAAGAAPSDSPPGRLRRHGRSRRRERSAAIQITGGLTITVPALADAKGLRLRQTHSKLNGEQAVTQNRLFNALRAAGAPLKSQKDLYGWLLDRVIEANG